MIATPSPVMELTGATALAVRGGHTCAKLGDGEMRCWGLGSNGELANKLGSARPLPVLNASGSNLASVASIAAGGNHSCAVQDSGAVLCWGWNVFGQIGDGSNVTRYRPAPISTLTSASTVVAGGDHSCALSAGGEVHCWGWNDDGQLGDATTLSRSVPVAVNGLFDATAIAAGWNHTCAIVTNGSVKCWGRNDHAQLGWRAGR